MALKFIDGDLPAPEHTDWSEVVAELRTAPGRWAEVRRSPKEKRGAVDANASYIRRTHPDLEVASRVVGPDVVLYVRAVTA